MAQVKEALGLDVGTSRIVLARQNGGGFEYRSQLNAFVEVPFSKVTANMLKKANVPHRVDGETIIVHGNECANFADMLQVEARRPMTRGIMNSNETFGSEVIAQLVATLLEGESTKNKRIYYSVPAAPAGEEANLTFHDASIGQVLRGLGFEAQSVNEGLAVVYSELEESNYSGIGISCGGGLCNVCVSYLAVPVMTFAVPKAGDFIDASAASVTGELATRIRIAKEQSFYINGHTPDKVQQVLSVYYDDMIRTLVAALVDACSSTRAPKFGKPVPIVLSGGTTMPKGFRERFEKLLNESSFPLAISEIRMAGDPLTATAKGALVAALAE